MYDQTLVIDGDNSKLFTIFSGVPQGKVYHSLSLSMTSYKTHRFKCVYIIIL